MNPLRLMVYDRTAGSLARAWWGGAKLYRGLGRLDAARGCTSWAEALEWLGSYGVPARIAEVQVWCHGLWGLALMDRERLDRAALSRDHRFHADLGALRERLAGPESLVWFRTCETFGAERGQQFAMALADFLRARVAGHTHVIGFWQSGLHSLAPGQQPSWSPAEGLLEGTPENPRRALASSPNAPHTISALHGRIPADW
jgi:hypothetical protein